MANPPNLAPTANTFRTIILASLGGGLEFYDFVAYGIFAAYIAPTFFPAGNETASLISTFAVFAAGFLVRPLGGIAFSHFGDRVGRRTTFLASLLGISLATGGMALCPGYAEWGIGATAAFVVLRLVQGFCLGGELPGAVTYLFEMVPPARSALVCSVLFACASGGVVLASLVSATLHALLPPAAMAQWGWRIAFGLGGVLGLLSYLPRRRLAESPVFAALHRRRALERLPLLQVLRRDWSAVVIGVGVTALLAGFNGILFAYMPAFLVRTAGYPASIVATAVTTGLVVMALMAIAAGALSDRIGARYTLQLGALAVLVIGPLFFRAAAAHTPHLAWWLTALGAAGGLSAGSFSVVLARLFGPSVRFSGVALAYNVGFALFSGVAPIVAVALIAATGSLAAPAFYLAGVAVITLAASLWVTKPVLSDRLAAMPGR